jgi:hypothetical protein
MASRLWRGTASDQGRCGDLKRAALKTSQLVALKTSQLVALKTSQLVALKTSQLVGMCWSIAYAAAVGYPGIEMMPKRPGAEADTPGYGAWCMAHLALRVPIAYAITDLTSGGQADSTAYEVV